MRKTKFKTLSHFPTAQPRRCRLLAHALVGIAVFATIGCQGLFNQADIIRVSESGVEQARKATREGVLLVEQQDFGPAEASFKRALRLDETYGPAHNNLGRIYFERGDLKRAAEAYHWAMEFMPGRAEPLNNLGLVFESAGNLDEAIDFYRQAHDLSPDNSEYLANFVRARIRRGDRDEQVRSDLQRLRFLEQRPEWIAWVEQTLVTLTVEATQGPESAPTIGRAARTIDPSNLPEPNGQITSEELPVVSPSTSFDSDGSSGPSLTSPQNIRVDASSPFLWDPP